MSLDKAIAHGKEHRKPYHGAKAIDRTCRNHGGCIYCANGRKHKFLRQMPFGYRDKSIVDNVDKEKAENRGQK